MAKKSKFVAEKSLGRELNYDAFLNELYANPREMFACESNFDMFVTDRPLIKDDAISPQVVIQGKTVNTGCIVSRVTTDRKKIFSQVVRFYLSKNRAWSAVLVDLLPKKGRSVGEKFVARDYEFGQLREQTASVNELTLEALPPSNYRFQYA